jgi:UDP-N-acetylglucosamine acyltransferase
MKQYSDNITAFGHTSIHSSAIIHPTAIIEAGAIIEENVKVGPYSIVGSDVVLKKGVELQSHVVVTGITIVGENTMIYPFAVVGEISQDMKYYNSKEFTPLVIGKNNIIREHVTIHMGTPASTGTVIGDNNLFMVGVHVAHDCIVGNNIYIANNALLAGHVEVDDYAIIGGQAAVLQFTHIGRNAMIGGKAAIKQDVLPYTLIEQPDLYRGLNLIGLKRKGFTTEQIQKIQSVYDVLFDESDVVATRIEKIKQQFGQDEDVKDIVKFLDGLSKYSFLGPK